MVVVHEYFRCDGFAYQLKCLFFNVFFLDGRAGEAVGGIVLLKHENGDQMTINVEYNQLDPMLRASGKVVDNWFRNFACCGC